MARVEITKSRGPEAVETFNRASESTAGKNYGHIVNVGNYTLHSYQVFSASSITFKILGSNVSNNGEPSTDFTNDWTVISSHAVSAGGSLAYSDSWNFQFSCIHITGASSNVRVLEKHNP